MKDLLNLPMPKPHVLRPLESVSYNGSLECGSLLPLCTWQFCTGEACCARTRCRPWTAWYPTVRSAGFKPPASWRDPASSEKGGSKLPHSKAQSATTNALHPLMILCFHTAGVFDNV